MDIVDRLKSTYNMNESCELAIIEIEALRNQLAECKKDSERLDYLDKSNARKNKQCGSSYGWKLEENCNRIALSDSNHPYKTVRQAIDEAKAMSEKV